MWLKSGGYIVINQTEALVAIDINTGKYVGKSNRLEDTIVKTNTDAMKEIVRQIRLRDLGGIIVVDFIDMDERKNRQKVMQALEEAHARRPRAVQDSPVQRFRTGGDHPQTRQAEPGAHAVHAVPVLRRRGLREESCRPWSARSCWKRRRLRAPWKARTSCCACRPKSPRCSRATRTLTCRRSKRSSAKPVIVKSDPLLHQEKFDLA